MKEVFEQQRSKLSTQKPDERRKRRGFNKVTAVAVSSAVAVAALAVLLPKKAKAETDSAVASLGTPFSQEINDFIWISSELQPQLIPGIATNDFTMTIPNDYEGYGDVSKVSFQIQDDDSTNGIVIQQVGAITSVPSASNPNYTETSYLEVSRGDGKNAKIVNVASGAEMFVDGVKKWDENTCNQYENFTTLHPSRNKGELKIVGQYNASDGCGSIYRVPLDAVDYCKEKILDSQESKLPCILSAPETKELLAVKQYKKITDTLPSYLLARKTDGTLLHLQRSTDGTWTKENPQKGMSDFAELENSLAMIERETPNGRAVTILVTDYYEPEKDTTTLKVIAFEKQPESTDDNPIWKEVPVAMTQDPTIILEELDGDGDGVKNGVDNCPSAKNPDQLDLNADGYGDACASADCKDFGGYPWEAGAQTTTNASGLTVCKSDLVPGFSAYVQPDQSMIHSDKDVVLDSAGNISAQSGQTLVYVHTQKAGTEALPAKKMIFPAGNSVELEIYSTEKLDGTPGTATLNYEDFLGNPVTVTFDGPTTWKSEGVMVGGELGVEGSYYKVVVGDENVVIGCPPVCNEEPPMPQTEPAVEPTAQVEPPTPQPEPIIVAEIPMPVAEPIADPVAEPAPDVVENPPETADAGSDADTGSVVIPPPPDGTVSSPEVDAVVYVDTPPGGSDINSTSESAVAEETGTTIQAEETQTGPPPESEQDTAQSPDTNPGSDTGIDTPQSENPTEPDPTPAKDEEGEGTDAPVQVTDSEKPQPLTDASSSADTIQNADTADQPKPKPQEKSGGGGSGGCAMESPNDSSALNPFMALGTGILAWVLRQRRKTQEILKK